MPRRISIQGKGADLFFGGAGLSHTVEAEVLSGGRSPLPRTARSRPPRERGEDRTIDRRNDHPIDRTKVRHSFDVYRDQLLHLSRLQMALYNETGRKPTLGDLVQQALDAFLRSNDRPDERSAEGEGKEA